MDMLSSGGDVRLLHFGCTCPHLERCVHVTSSIGSSSDMSQRTMLQTVLAARAVPTWFCVNGHLMPIP